MSGQTFNAEVVYMLYDAVFSERDRLEAENAKLREQLDAKEHNERRNLREYKRVTDENDRLRELVRDLTPFHEHAWDGDRDGCSWCNLHPDSCDGYPCPISIRIRMLGSEDSDV